MLTKEQDPNIFTSPSFVPGEATDKVKRESREFHIPKLERERSLYGSGSAEFFRFALGKLIHELTLSGSVL